MNNYAEVGFTVAARQPSVKTRRDEIRWPRQPMTVHAHPRYLIVTDAAALLLAEALLVGIRQVRVLVSPLAFWLLTAALVIGFASDVALWFRRGVRSVSLEDEVLTTYRGPELLPRAIARRDLAWMKVTQFPGAGRVKLRSSTGLRERISEQAFPPKEFARFVSALKAWER